MADAGMAAVLGITDESGRKMLIVSVVSISKLRGDADIAKQALSTTRPWHCRGGNADPSHDVPRTAHRHGSKTWTSVIRAGRSGAIACFNRPAIRHLLSSHLRASACICGSKFLLSLGRSVVRRLETPKRYARRPEIGTADARRCTQIRWRRDAAVECIPRMYGRGTTHNNYRGPAPILSRDSCY